MPLLGFGLVTIDHAGVALDAGATPTVTVRPAISAPEMNNVMMVGRRGRDDAPGRRCCAMRTTSASLVERPPYGSCCEFRTVKMA